jgi:predicted kinase
MEAQEKKGRKLSERIAKQILASAKEINCSAIPSVIKKYCQAKTSKQNQITQKCTVTIVNY